MYGFVVRDPWQIALRIESRRRPVSATDAREPDLYGTEEDQEQAGEDRGTAADGGRGGPEAAAVGRGAGARGVDSCFRTPCLQGRQRQEGLRQGARGRRIAGQRRASPPPAARAAEADGSQAGGGRRSRRWCRLSRQAQALR